MRTGTPFVLNGAPRVFIAFINKSFAQVGNTYSNDGFGSTDRRILHIETKSAPYSGEGLIRLANQDGHFDNTDLRGCKVTLQWSYAGGTGSVDEPWWVVRQSNISVEGKLIVEVQLANAWSMLVHSRGINVADDSDMTSYTTGINRIWDRDTTVLNIITEIITASTGFLAQWNQGYLTTLGSEPAGAFAIQTYEPLAYSTLDDNDMLLLRRLLQLSRSAITFRNDTGATINYIDPSTPGPYYTYELDGVEHPFYIHVKGNAIIIPNRIIYADREPDPSKGQVANFVGLAEDGTSIAQIGSLTAIYYDGTIGSIAGTTPTGAEITAGNLEATARAETHLARMRAEAELGELYVPMNCCVELYDEIEINDTRSGDTVRGRVGQIERRFSASANDTTEETLERELFTTHIKLGGLGGGSTLIKSLSGGNDIDATILDLKSRSLSNPFISGMQVNGGVLSQHYAPDFFHQVITNDVAISGLTWLLDLAVSIRGSKVPRIAKVTLQLTVAPGTVTDGDYCYAGILLDGLTLSEQVGGVMVFEAQRDSAFGFISRTWAIPIPGDGAGHTIIPFAQESGGDFVVSEGTSPDSDIIVELISAQRSELP